MRFSKKRLASYILIAMVALLIGTTIGSLDTVAPHSKADNSSLTQEQTEELIVTARNVFADIAEKADPAIVLVKSEIKVESNQSPHPFFDDPFFQYFFGDQFEVPQRQRITEGFGSGFIVAEDGYIVTNEHVVHNAEKINVTINGFEEPVPAEIAWADFELDLAVLKINVDRKLATLQMGNSDQIRPGDWAIAIGNPLGFAHTVTTGVISALGRPISIPSREERSRYYPNLIQTDAAINPGNSGGPLLNINGEVIGINTAVSIQGQGIGFAIPVNEVKDIVKDLKEKGEIIRPWLGFSYGELSSKFKEQYQEYYRLTSLDGVIVKKVVPDSPAEKAGLQPNDIITRIDDQEIVKLNDVKKMIDLKEIGDTIKIEVIRNGHSNLVFARIGRKPDKVY